VIFGWDQVFGEGWNVVRQQPSSHAALSASGARASAGRITIDQQRIKTCAAPTGRCLRENNAQRKPLCQPLDGAGTTRRIQLHDKYMASRKNQAIGGVSAYRSLSVFRT